MSPDAPRRSAFTSREVRSLTIFGGGFFIILFAANLGQNVGLSFLLEREGASSLPFAFIVNAVALGILSYLTRALVARFRLRTVMVAIFGVLCVGVLVVRSALAARATWAPTSVYVLGFTAADLSLVLFWSLANRTYDTREAKRLFPIVSAIGTLGGSLSGFLARWVINSGGMGALFMLWAVSVVASAVWSFLFATTRTTADDPGVDDDPSASETRDPSLEKSLLAGLALIVIVTLVGRFLYGTALRMEYVRDEEIAATNGMLIGIANAATFLVQLLVASRLMSALGVGAVGLIYPVAMLGCFGALYVNFGMPAAIACFFGITTLRYGIQGVVENVLYTPMPPRAAARLLALVTAVGMPAGMVAAGVLLNVLSTQTSQTIALVGMASALALILLAFARGSAYRSALRRRLMKGGSGVRVRLALLLQEGDATVGSVLVEDLAPDTPDVLERLRTLIRSQQRMHSHHDDKTRIEWRDDSRLGRIARTRLRDSYRLLAAEVALRRRVDASASPPEVTALAFGAIRHALSTNTAIILAALHAGSQHGDFDRISLRIVDADRRVRAAAAEILDGLLPEPLRALVLPLIEERRRGDGLVAARAAFDVDWAAIAADPVAELLEYPDDWVRATVAYVVPHLAERSYVQRLTILAEAEDPFLSFAARHALGAVSS